MVINFLELIVLGMIAIVDARKKIIPDFLLAVLLLIGFVNELIMNKTGTAERIVFSVCIFTELELIRIFIGGLGFGDVKLMSVIAAIMSFDKAIYIFLTGLFFAVLYWFMLENKKTVFERLERFKEKIPLAPFIFCGFLVVMLF